MKKQILKSALIALAGVGLMSGVALAVPNLAQVGSGSSYDWSAYASYTDTGANEVYLIDTDGVSDTSVSTLYFALGDYSTLGYLSFGLYDLESNGTISTLKLFDTNALHSTSVTFKSDGTAVAANGNTANIDYTFGFYLYNSSTKKFIYSDTALNNGLDLALIFNTSTIGLDELANADVVVAFEDLLTGIDYDYNDVVVGVSDVAPVPEPATMLLFGTGMLGLAAAARRKNSN